MEKEQKITAVFTVAAVVLILIIGGVYFGKNKASEKNTETGKAKAEAVTEESILEKQDEKEQTEEVFFYAGKLPDIMGKSAEELYRQAFSGIEEKDNYVHYYIKEGTLFLDEYKETGSYDEDGLAIYEWNREQRIADDVIYVDYNGYGGGALAIYITEDHVLHGNYGFGYCEEIYLENMKYARAYAEQIIALGMDGSLWCLGKSFSISDGRKLIYHNWQKVLENVVYASLGHYNYMAITTDGSLYMWGDNTYGQFGDGSLLKEDTGFEPDCYFYEEPVKVADNVKMVWQGKPGEQYGAEYEEPDYLRSYILTLEDRLYVCGQEVNDEIRRFTWFGELGNVKDFYALEGVEQEYVEVNCTSRLHLVQ